MKKNIIYIGLALIVGLLVGFLIFGGNTTSKSTKDHSEEVAANQMWTCSMHPQIMQPEPGDCPLCGMDLIPAEAGAEGLSPNEIKMSKNAMALANIQTMVVGKASETEDNSLMLSGKIMPNEEANAVQASYFEGRIEKLNVSFTGEKVNKGQLLATIYAPALVAAQQELLTAASMKASQPALYNAVRNKLKLWKLSDTQIDAIEASGKVQENFPVYATVSGTVSEKLVEEGDYVSQGQAIVKVSNLGTVWAMFDAYENQISKLKVGQKISVSSNAYPNKKFEATISFIDPSLNTQSRTVAVRATLNNKDGIFKPGMFVTTKVQISINGENQSQVSVPATAVLWTGNRSLVYVKTNPNEPIFEMREVGLGAKNGDNYAITEGLSNGEEVVVNGTFTIDAAAQLQGKKSMMNNADGHDDHHGMDPEYVSAMERLIVPVDFQNQLKAVFNDYIKLKDALVKDDSNKVSDDAKNMLNNLKYVDIKLLSDNAAHEHWANLEMEIETSANAIIKETGVNLQRNHFKNLSLRLINAVETFGVNEKVYLQFCPMANNDKGGYWLSKEDQVLNPYFGDAMLKCGEVKEVIE